MIKKLLLIKKMVPPKMFKNRKRLDLQEKTRFDVNLMARSSTTHYSIENEFNNRKHRHTDVEHTVRHFLSP